MKTYDVKLYSKCGRWLDKKVKAETPQQAQAQALTDASTEHQGRTWMVQYVREQ